MRKSNYAMDLGLANGKRIIYSTMTRRYVEYAKEEMDIIGFINNLDKHEYTSEEIMIFNELYQAKLVCKDADDEAEAFRLFESEKREKSKVLNITTFMNNKDGKCLGETVVSNILSIARKKAKLSRVININWCGEETVDNIEEIRDVMDQLEVIAKRYRCKLFGTMATSCKQLTVEQIVKIKGSSIGCVSVSLDDVRSSCELDSIINNICTCLEVGLLIDLHIDLNDFDKMEVRGILGRIPEKFRTDVRIHLSNEPENENMHSTYKVYRMSFDMGYLNYNRENCIMKNDSNERDSFVINGDISNRDVHKYAKTQNGMTLEERAYLDYYFDKTKEKLA